MGRTEGVSGGGCGFVSRPVGLLSHGHQVEHLLLPLQRPAAQEHRCGQGHLARKSFVWLCVQLTRSATASVVQQQVCCVCVLSNYAQSILINTKPPKVHLHHRLKCKKIWILFIYLFFFWRQLEFSESHWQSQLLQPLTLHSIKDWESIAALQIVFFFCFYRSSIKAGEVGLFRCVIEGD